MLDTKMNPTQNHQICKKQLGGKNKLDIPNFNGVAMIKPGFRLSYSDPSLLERETEVKAEIGKEACIWELGRSTGTPLKVTI